MRRLGFDLFHKFFSWISDMPIESDSGVFCLMDHRALEQFNRLTETNRFIPGLRTWLGFCQESIYYDRRERAAGEPKQTLRSLFKYALDGIFSFSYKPLRLITCTGIAISVIGLSLAVWFIAKRLLGVETAQTGFTTLVTLITCFGGFQLVAFGVVGEYIASI